MDAVLGELVTAGSTDPTQLVVTDVDDGSAYEFMITVISGTIKFGKGSVHANAHGWGAGDVVFFNCSPREIYFEAASSNDTFVVL